MAIVIKYYKGDLEYCIDIIKKTGMEKEKEIGKTFEIKEETWKLYKKAKKKLNKFKKEKKKFEEAEDLDIIYLMESLGKFKNLSVYITKKMLKFWSKVYKDTKLSNKDNLTVDYENRKIIYNGKRK